VKALRKVFTAITSELEDAITFTGFIATEAGIASHLVTENVYGFRA